MRDSGASYDDIAKTTGCSVAFYIVIQSRVLTTAVNLFILKVRQAIVAKAPTSALKDIVSAGNMLQAQSAVAQSSKFGHIPTPGIKRKTDSNSKAIVPSAPNNQNGQYSSSNWSGSSLNGGQHDGGYANAGSRHTAKTNVPIKASVAVNTKSGSSRQQIGAQQCAGRSGKSGNDSSDDESGATKVPASAEDVAADQIMCLVNKDCKNKLHAQQANAAANAAASNATNANRISTAALFSSSSSSSSTGNVININSGGSTFAGAGAGNAAIDAASMRVPVVIPGLTTASSLRSAAAAVQALFSGPRGAIEQALHGPKPINSSITMTISDTMLNPDYNSAFSNGASSSGSSTGATSMSMSTAMQATRPMVLNTKLFHAVNASRKGSYSRKYADIGDPTMSGSAVLNTLRNRNTLVRRAGVVDDDDDDEEEEVQGSDDEEEDSAVLAMLGEKFS